MSKSVENGFGAVSRSVLGTEMPRNCPNQRRIADTQGLLQRASIIAGEIVPIGKEADRHWEQGEDMSMIDFRVLEYRKSGMVVADPTLQDEIAQSGIRELMRKTGLSQHTIESIREGKTVRRKTLQRVVQFLTEKKG